MSKSVNITSTKECKNHRQALKQLKLKKWDLEFRSDNQKIFHDTIDNKDVVFCSGPAGTGKTFIAVRYALQALASKNSPFDGIIITKPLVEADGEKLGFLPGDIDEKTDPFMMSFYYNMEQLIGKKIMDVLIAYKIIKVIPLAYMRGLTLDRKIVLLDEAQNCTVNQIKMFLTRIGIHSKFIVTGDVEQTDRKHDNGLHDSLYRLSCIEEIGICSFHKKDIVRHNLVGKILDMYNIEFPSALQTEFMKKNIVKNGNGVLYPTSH